MKHDRPTAVPQAFVPGAGPALDSPVPAAPPVGQSPRESRSAANYSSVLALLMLCPLVLLLSSSPAASAPPAATESGVALVNVASDPATGLAYRREPSPRNLVFDAIKQEPLYTVMDIARTPLKPNGAPGLALIDFDRDGDLDLYVTNGPGAANSLFENRLVPDGSLAFVDVAMAVGAGLADQDSSGVCFGDTDNDGDEDLLVLGSGEPSRFLENRLETGSAWFEDHTAASGLGGGNRWSSSCSMGDVNGDGLLDVVVGNTFTDWNQQAAIVALPFAQNEHDQLFVNRGGNLFDEVGAAAGIHDLAAVPPGAATITWAIALVDLDGDGDLDLVHADDQAAIPAARYGGLDRGYIQIFDNDGSGHFTNRTVAAGTNKTGQWMGLTFGDFNCDGRLDLFGSNLGDYMASLLPLPYTRGDSTSRWFLQRPDGSFDDPFSASSALRATPFGWGASSFDYDADGDLDLVFQGGLDVGPFIDASNPGMVLANPGCSADFVWDHDALPSVDHRRRTVQGVAVGDLDLDGYPDVVSVSSADEPDPLPLLPYPVSWGSPIDPPVASWVPIFQPTGNPGEFVWSGFDPDRGTLVVEIASPPAGAEGNRSVSVLPVGTAGLTTGGRVNRSGIGAQVTVTPLRGQPSTRPVLGGSSYASQDALAQPFGLGQAPTATVEILWPGGTRNRLYGVRPGERILFPEIPCSFDGEWSSPAAYRTCVREALIQAEDGGLLDPNGRARLMGSAFRAFAEQ